MKKILKVSVAVVVFCLLSCSLIANAASYPFIIPKLYSLRVPKGHTAILEFTVFHEFNDEKYHVNIYKGGSADPSKLVATKEGTAYNYDNLMTEITVYWDTFGVEPGLYTVEYYMSFYSFYEWHESPRRSAAMTITVIEAPNPNVTVTIPTTPITVNGKKIDNTNAQYPYIVYNNITYCPMTYAGSRFLGLESNWSQVSGLSISKLAGGSSGSGDNSTTAAQNTESYPAVMASGKIEVNGNKIDNYAEEYPLLVFRDVTYFPLTWKFAVTEFGWDYNYTNETGLVINSK